MDSMHGVRKAIGCNLAALGYSVTWRHMTKCDFNIGSHSGGFEIRSANPRRFEACILVRNESDALMPCTYDSDARNFTITTRFRKDDSDKNIAAIVEWVSKACKRHHHLHMVISLHSTAPQQPYDFSSATGPINVNGAYTHGVVKSCKIIGIVELVGCEAVVHKDLADVNEPYFLVELDNAIGYYSIPIVTDGNKWYPVWVPKSNKYIIWDKIPGVSELRKMNSSDLHLIHAAVGDYSMNLMREKE